MNFVDQVRLKVKAGDGGNGAVAFRRELYVPFGGPAGGDGGRGGSVILVAEEGRTSLLDLAHMPVLRGKRGEHGRGSDQYGKGGEDLIVKVPVGTQVFDESTGLLIADLTEHDVPKVIAQGGDGGRGNIHFATSFDRAPRRADPGTLGEEKTLRLELKVLADVGLLGFPNVGKSTLVATVSKARPKIADYPFTTLRPHLGVVRIGGNSSTATFVVADIPGLIPGASEGTGLGARFLKHVERCRALLHLVAPPTDELSEEGREPLADFDALMHELRQFAPELAARPMIVAMSKGDLPETQEAFEEARKRFAKRKIKLRLISAANRLGMEQLMRDLYRMVKGHAPEDDDGEADAHVEEPEAELAPTPKKAKSATSRASERTPTAGAAKGTGGGKKTGKLRPRVSPTAPKVSHAAPKVTKTAPKGSKTAPKVSPTAPKVSKTAPKGKKAAAKGTKTAAKANKTAPKGTKAATKATKKAPKGAKAATKATKPTTKGGKAAPKRTHVAAKKTAKAKGAKKPAARAR